MDRRTQAHQDPPGRDPSAGRGPDPDARDPRAQEGRPSSSVGVAFARTAGHSPPDFNRRLDGAPDPRRQGRVEYHEPSLLWYGILLFVGKLGSRRRLDFEYREQGAAVPANVNRLAQTDQHAAPHGDTLGDHLAKAGAGPVAALRAGMMGRLIRMRALDEARVRGRLVLGVGGTGCLVFRWKHRENRLTRKCGEDALYCHQAPEARVLGPAEAALSLGSEFTDNRDAPAGAGEQKRKQDRESKASGRLLAAARRDSPRLSLCLSLDAPCACGAGSQLGKDSGASCVIVFEQGSTPTSWAESRALLDLSPANRLEVTEGGWRHTHRWADELRYADSDRRQRKLKAIHHVGEGPGGGRSEWAWPVSFDPRVSKQTVERVAWGAGGARWREEDQGFDVQKTSGLNLGHAYSEKDRSGAYYLPLRVAHVLLRSSEKGGLLRALAEQAGKESAVALPGSLKNIAESLVESLRDLLRPAGAFGQERIQIRLDSS